MTGLSRLVNAIRHGAGEGKNSIVTSAPTSSISINAPRRLRRNDSCMIFTLHRKRSLHTCACT